MTYNGWYAIELNQTKPNQTKSNQEAKDSSRCRSYLAASKRKLSFFSLVCKALAI